MIFNINKFQIFPYRYKMYFFPFILCFAFGMTACSGFQNLTVTDVMIPENRYVSGTINASLDSIDKAVQWYGYHCSPSNPLTLDFDGENKNAARGVGYTIGWTQSNPTTIINFERVDEHSTSYVTYANDYRDRKGVDEYLKYLNLALGKQCP